MAPSNNAIIQSSQNWQRINLIGELCIKDSLLDVLHNKNNDPSYVGLPENGIQLYSMMVTFKTTHEVRLRRVIRPNQWDIICPASGSCNTKDWDIPIIKVVIQYNVPIPPPIGGWEKALHCLDVTKAAHVCRAKDIRNELKHGTIKDMCNVNRYNNLLSRIEIALLGMNYRNMDFFEELKHCTLKVYTPQTVEILENTLSDIRDELNSVNNDAELFKKTVETSDFKTQLQRMQCNQDDVNRQLETLMQNTKLIQDEFRRASDQNFTQITKIISKGAEIQCTLEKIIKQNEMQIKHCGMQIDQNKARIDQNGLDIETLKALQDGGQNIQDGVSDEVWQTLSENKSFTLAEWRILSERLGYGKGNAVTNIFNWRRNIPSVKSHLQVENISWKILKKELNNLNREDIIEEFCAKTNLTTDLDLYLRDFKRNTKKTLETQRTTKPFQEKFGLRSSSKPTQTKHEAYVNLAVAEGQYMDEKWCGDEREFQQMKFNIPKEKFKNIGIDELFSADSKVVIVSGIAGVGKSTLCDEIKYRWANDEIFTGDNGMPKIDLLLTITCRELNTRHIDASSSDIFTHLFPELPETNLLSDISNKILLLIDGADELRSIESIREFQKHPLVNAFYQLVNLSKQKCFDRIMITSRPKTAYALCDLFKKELNLPTRRVEVCGFNEDSVKAFVHNEFHNASKTKEVLDKINESSTMQAMASIPIYLWVLCGLYHEDTSVNIPSTMTELLLYSSLAFIRNVFKENGHKLKDESLNNLVKDQEVIQHFISLATISYKTLNQRKVVFFGDESDIDIAQLDNLEKVGFLVKYKHGEDGMAYQYRHLVFQEIFAALHILGLDDGLAKEECYRNDNLRDCLQFVAGLEGIVTRETSPKIFKRLLKAVIEFKEPTNGFHVMENMRIVNSIENYMDHLFNSASNKSDNYRLYISCYCERSERPSKHVLESIAKVSPVLLLQSLFYKELSFWMDVLPYIERILNVTLPRNNMSVNQIKDCVCLSKKARSIRIDIGSYESILEYYTQLSKALEEDNFLIESLYIHGYSSSKNGCQIKEIFSRIACHTGDITLDDLESDTVTEYLNAIKKSFQQYGEQSQLKKLSVTFSQCMLRTMKLLCQLFQHLDEIVIHSNVRLTEHNIQMIHQHMNKNNKLKRLTIDCSFTSLNYLSLQSMKCLNELNIQCDYTPGWLHHLFKELNKMATSREVKQLTVLKLRRYNEFEFKEIFKDFTKLLKTISKRVWYTWKDNGHTLVIHLRK